MAYSSRHNKRPFEAASKSSHSRLIHSQTVKDYLGKCRVHRIDAKDIKSEVRQRVASVEYAADNDIQYVVAVDSGSVDRITINDNGSELAVIQFGILLLKIPDLENLYTKPFISQKDLQNLKKDSSGQLILPIANISYEDRDNIRDSFRLTIYEFFKQYELLETLKWLICKEFSQHDRKDTYTLKHCPNLYCQDNSPIVISEIKAECDQCKKVIFITDALGVHEEITETTVPQEVVKQTIYLIEAIIIFDNVRRIIGNPQIEGKIRNILFLIDGQLMMRGLSHPASGESLLKVLRDLTSFLLTNHNLNLIAIEKSGPFVRYADIIGRSKNKPPLLGKGEFVILDSELIYNHIIPDRGSAASLGYGAFTHYGTKMIFRDRNGGIYVFTMPPWVKNPTQARFPNLHNILATVEKIKCDRYDNSVLPITLINKYISLSFNPSKDILRKFLVDQINNL